MWMSSTCLYWHINGRRRASSSTQDEAVEPWMMHAQHRTVIGAVGKKQITVIRGTTTHLIDYFTC